MREQTRKIEELQQRLSNVEAEQHHFKELYRLADIEVDTLRADRERMREALQDVVPMNWCDSLLTGPNAVLGKPYTYDGADIERLLRAIKGRLDAALSSTPTPETTP